MKVVLTPRAVREAKRRKTWWLENSSEASDLFDTEVAAAIALLQRAPRAGVVHEETDGVTTFRLLLPRTATHLYYAIADDRVVVLSFWGARKGHGPRLTGE